jgi:hypothetical protein
MKRAREETPNCHALREHILAFEEKMIGIRAGPHVSKHKKMAKKQQKILAFGVSNDEEAKGVILPPIDGETLALAKSALPSVDARRNSSALDKDLVARFKMQNIDGAKKIKKRLECMLNSQTPFSFASPNRLLLLTWNLLLIVHVRV